MKKGLLGLFSLAIGGVIALSSCGNNSTKAQIVSTCFAGYDFSKAVAKDLKSSSMLLNPGEELHDYSPSVGDIEKIISSEVFVYIGGESDAEWVEKQILPEIDKTKTKVISMMDVVKSKGVTYEEENPTSAVESEEHEHAEGEEEEEELDEHVWNSIANAKLITTAICDALCEIDSNNKDTYTKNMTSYVESLTKLDTDIKSVVSTSSKKMLVFADRFPLLYFVKEYGLSYDAAFKGCETAHEANPVTIEGLTNTVKENNLKVVFVIELSESNIADTVITNCKNDGITVEKMVFYTMHNVSKDDYQAGKTYVDFMNQNIESLKVALN